MQSAIDELEKKGQAAKVASRKLAHLPTEVKNKALMNIAQSLISREEEILEVNKLDCDEARASGMDEAMLDRLLLNSSRIQAMAQDVRTVASLPDPVGESYDARVLPNGLHIERRRVPLGVIGVIYESRPNVTVDISSLCLKSGNAVILRGGKEALRSNAALVRVIKDAIGEMGVPQDVVQFIESTERALVNQMLKMKDAIDLIIPRGGEALVALVAENATMPVLASGVGVCHTYVDQSADPEKAVAICYNAKVQRPTVCNALDCLLVHRDIAERFLPMVAEEWAKAGVEMHCDERARGILERLSDISGLETLTSWSGPYTGKPYLYWWDITPRRRAKLEELGKIVLAKKDSGERCVVLAKDLLPLLTPDRQTTRKARPWGIRVVPNFPDKLKVEGTPSATSAYLKVVWLPSSQVPGLKLAPASDEDWGKEFLALVAAIRVVDSLDEALEHIQRYGSGHSEAILTEDYSAAMRFLDEVDAACVYVNASTRFTDGGQFGLGAEVGISTQKFHARGPMGLKELTTYKWVIMGSGQVRA